MNTNYTFALDHGRAISRDRARFTARNSAPFAPRKDAPRSPARAILTAVPAETPTFSPLVQEFLDECGYSDK